jgi:hypothetical protein
VAQRCRALRRPQPSAISSLENWQCPLAWRCRARPIGAEARARTLSVLARMGVLLRREARPAAAADRASPRVVLGRRVL